MNLHVLQASVRELAALEETEAVIISCYVDLEGGVARVREALDGRVRVVRRVLPHHQRHDFEAALAQVQDFLVSEFDTKATGAAVFARGGKTPFFRSVQLQVPVPNRFLVDSVPNIYDLVLLKDTFHRYVLLISTEGCARILEVSLGSVTKEVWTERPALRQRVGREWTREHYQNHRRDRSQRFIKEKVRLLDRLVTEHGHTHLMLAGDSQSVARVRGILPKRLLKMLVDTVPISSRTATKDVVIATLASFAEHEERESLEMAGLLLDELLKGGLAAAGTAAVLEALRLGQVDALVLADAYEPPPGWRCKDCASVGAGAIPAACADCGGRSLSNADLKGEIVRMAEQSGSAIEIVRNSDALLNIGGVGCLLRYRIPQQDAVDRRAGYVAAS